jgi:hypothetical protein
MPSKLAGLAEGYTLVDRLACQVIPDDAAGVQLGERTWQKRFTADVAFLAHPKMKSHSVSPRAFATSRHNAALFGLCAPSSHSATAAAASRHPVHRSCLPLSTHAHGGSHGSK